jgi:hypothetical protein
VIVYLWAAFFINLIANIIGDFKDMFPWWMQSNNPLYNLHSIVRFACFASFFMALKQPHFSVLKKVLPFLSLSFIIFNFTLNESFFYPEHISGNLHAAEAYLLLIYCLIYYLSELKEESETIAAAQEFWVTTGLCIYVVINFFVFLFYVPLINQGEQLANEMWDIHNVAYIFLCLFIAKAFYVPVANRYKN